MYGVGSERCIILIFREEALSGTYGGRFGGDEVVGTLGDHGQRMGLYISYV